MKTTWQERKLTPAGMKTCSGTECVGWIAVWMMKTQREQYLYLTKTYSVHIYNTNSCAIKH
jgi:hypothetical protein